ncbi:response regulator [Sulfurimonas sp. C5]|uniref:response regulator n=1 Tax=Sulfurimonas sp. C5 TaxID=3036947 RepID=UPI002454FF71|nr:response regulator [Sulfurimonas sp. C5]MDH4943685.1 response regulator [Sulfurimonas sp. C5]
MLEELQNNLDLIGMTVAGVLLIAYVIYKIKQKSSSEELVEDELDTEAQVKTSVAEDEYDATEVSTKPAEQEPEKQEEITEAIEEEVTQKEEKIIDLEPQDMGTEEGDFGVQEEEITQPETETVQETQKKAFQKRDVPPHGKISKDDFKDFAGKRILLAEDNLINQKVILGLLADSGIEVVVANDGAEALSILQHDNDFIVILMDAHMPNIDGFEATRRIRANSDYAHIVVVALSGDTAADDIRKMTEAGMSEHLEKPLKMDSLYDILYAYSGSASEEQEDEADVVNVVSTIELDGDKGLEICGGDEDFYHEILKEFLQTYSQSDEQLTTLLHSKELEQADKLLLDIVGVSANIGAIKLNNIATHMKDLLSDEEESYMTLLPQYQHHLGLLVEDIKEYLQ